MSDAPPPLDSQLVFEFVSVAHNQFEKTQAMLAQEPRLLNATWDWGGGDFESALGAAAHTGSREIALHLLDKGARMDLFAAAMLGELAIVKAILTAYPDLAHSTGAHDIPLIVHAEMGGEPAVGVLAYLK